jgi:hypothetical protein
MLIQIVRSDNRCDSVEGFMLDGLIETNDVVKFKRGTEWVTIGQHQIRKRNSESVFKKERRAVNDSFFEDQYHKAYLSSLDPF